ncbi:unnamed protein product [Phytophthora fragariaefolia]|uniref:Unnamed protein product n=1 Tax=Phytophthora fragariaefolia TaxID=1490495 RepID=A0A9W6Y7P0_9STRA|nr:unnamed protein product [Phytophthora fragariaefolia]
MLTTIAFCQMPATLGLPCSTQLLVTVQEATALLGHMYVRVPSKKSDVNDDGGSQGDATEYHTRKGATVGVPTDTTASSFKVYELRAYASSRATSYPSRNRVKPLSAIDSKHGMH